MTQVKQQKHHPRPGTMTHRIVYTLATAPEAELTARQLRIRCGVQGGNAHRAAYQRFMAMVSRAHKIGLIHRNGYGLYSAMEDV